MVGTEILWFDQILKLSLKSCARKQALLLWRLRFEDIEQFQTKPHGHHLPLKLRESAVNWPWLATTNHAAWAAYVLASAHASFEVVADLHRCLVQEVKQVRFITAQRIAHASAFSS